MRRSRRVMAVAVSVPVIAAATFASVSQAIAGAKASAARAVSYADPSGDAQNGPDVTSTKVSRLSNGWIRFTLSIANRPSGIRAGDVVYIAVDTDRSSATGINVTHSTDPKKQGPDYAFTMYYAGGSTVTAGEFKLPTGQKPVSIGENGTILEHVASGTWTITVEPSKMHNAKHFAFFIWTYSNPSSSGNLDFAPNKGEYLYPKPRG
jgi:hypothetical protein